MNILDFRGKKPWERESVTRSFLSFGVHLVLQDIMRPVDSPLRSRSFRCL